MLLASVLFFDSRCMSMLATPPGAGGYGSFPRQIKDGGRIVRRRLRDRHQYVVKATAPAAAAAAAVM